MKSLYIHLPFCKHKCLYCDFNSYSNIENLIPEYVVALKNEIQSYSFKYYKTIYFGGGTPSILEGKYIKDILETVEYKEAEEVTLEVNPGTVNLEKLIEYKKIGINRLSIGLQAVQDDILKEIGRIHTLKDFENAFKDARTAGFDNISVDLMFGLPKQTLENVKESVEYIINLGVEHVSCYSLILHERVFENLPDEETEREMYHYIVKRLREAGYEQYEISNFAKPGYEAKHNLVYWNQEEYVGVGAGASSYIDNTRYTNENNVRKYIEDFTKRTIEERQTFDDKISEYMILKTRLVDGVNIEEANKKFEVNLLEKFKNQIEKLVRFELVENTGTHIRLTEKGMDLANLVWEEFV